MAENSRNLWWQIHYAVYRQEGPERQRRADMKNVNIKEKAYIQEKADIQKREDTQKRTDTQGRGDMQGKANLQGKAERQKRAERQGMEEVQNKTEMDALLKELMKRRQKMKEVAEYASASIAKAPAGTLRISHKFNTEQYFHRTDLKDTNGKYIKKNNSRLRCALAQKDYAQKLLHMAENNVCKLDEFIQEYRFNGIMETYDGLSDARRKMVIPYELPDEQYVVKWMSHMRKEMTDSHLKPVNEELGISTENGELVRSKSEKILADKFREMHIPYQYEQPLYLADFGYINPDFLLLNVRTRKEYYWEHLGLMDNPEYCDKAVKKIECFISPALDISPQSLYI
jgi:hypothetical protein